MRLVCPNCATEYEVSEGMLGSGGSHVQCSACHTRWFAAAPAVTQKLLSEDQIIARLENWTSRPRPYVVASRDDDAPDDAPPDAPIEDPPPEPASADPAADAGPEFDWLDPDAAPETPPEPLEPPLSLQTEPNAADAAEPVPVAASERAARLDRPAAEADTLRPERAPGPRGNGDPRPGHPARGSRLALSGASDPFLPARAAHEPSTSHFGRGLLVALALGAVALALYVYAADFGNRLPAAEPALAAYAEQVDAARDWIESAVPPLPWVD